MKKSRSLFKLIMTFALIAALMCGNLIQVFAAEEVYSDYDSVGKPLTIKTETHDKDGDIQYADTWIYNWDDNKLLSITLKRTETTYTADGGGNKVKDTETTSTIEITDESNTSYLTDNPAAAKGITDVNMKYDKYKSTKSGTDQAKDAIEDIKDGLNVKADISAAAGTLAPIIEIVNTVIGILATAILILVGLFTAIDILYLEVPALHESMDGKAMEKGQSNKSGGVKPKIVSEDASNAYKEATEQGKNVLITYLKKRVVAYVAVAIVLYMLLSGNLSLIVEVVLKMLNGVFGWVEDYSKTMPS